MLVSESVPITDEQKAENYQPTHVHFKKALQGRNGWFESKQMDFCVLNKVDESTIHVIKKNSRLYFTLCSSPQGI